jgi:hypothetical protein
LQWDTKFQHLTVEDSTQYKFILDKISRVMCALELVTVGSSLSRILYDYLCVGDTHERRYLSAVE